MTEQGSRRVVVRVPRPPNCYCGNAVGDDKGRVLVLNTCPICMKLLLSSMRGREYAIAHVKGGDTVKRVLLKQKEFFSA